MKLTLDFETRSKVDLKMAGMYRYAEDKSTEVLCLAIGGVPGEPVLLWAPDRWRALAPEGLPWISSHRLESLIARADSYHAHNAGFELVVWQSVMIPMGFSRLDPARMYCSAAKAAAMAFPRDLARACSAAGIPVEKDLDGRRIMLKMCKPRTPTKNNPSEWHEDPTEYRRLCEYCLQDVRAEMALDERLPGLSPRERSLWLLDWAINSRGVSLDLPAIANLRAKAEAKGRALLRRMRAITSGAVDSPRQVARVQAWLRSRGADLPDLQRATVEAALATDLPDDCREVLAIRQALSKSSVAKLDRMAAMACADGRVRGTMLYHGASTGRWAGRGIQPQNLPRTDMTEGDIGALLSLGVAEAEAASNDPAGIMASVSQALRGVIVPGKGRRFVCADFSSIEARVLAWLAADEKALDVFRSGRDPYKVAASSIYGVDYEDVTGAQRQIGKVCIAEGQEVLTDRGLIPIEKLPLDCRLWDGVEWVEHGGLIYNGTRRVMTYDGLTATPDHIVFTESGRTIPLRDAAAQLERIARTGYGRTPLRYGADTIRGTEKGKDALGGVGAQGTNEMRGVRKRALDQLAQFETGENQRVPKLYANDKPELCATCEKVPRHTLAVQQSGGGGIQELRRPGHPLQVQIMPGVCALGGGKPTPRKLQRGGDRPHRQRGALRPGKLAPRNEEREQPKQAQHKEDKLQGRPCIGRRCLPRTPGDRSGGALRRKHGETFGGVSIPRGNTRPVLHSAELQTKRVYDIANAGPRNRFTVSGRLVHNCELALGYQGWVGAFAAMASGYGVHVEEEEAANICGAWRDGRPATVAFWRQLERAALACVADRRPVIVGRVRFETSGSFLRLVLPSGRRLAYCRPRIVEREDSYGRRKNSVAFLGVNSVTNKWETQHTYGGKLAEHCTQAAARDFLREALFTVAQSGEYEPVLHVHDEILTETTDGPGGGTVEGLVDLMRRLPPWAEGCPIDAEGWTGYRYRK